MTGIDDLTKEFLVESYENLDQLDRDFVALEHDPHAKDKLGSIFRTIHTIKGTCGCLGFSKLESVAHVGENLLSRLRDGELLMDVEMTSGLLKLADSIREILGFIESAGNEGGKDYADVKELLVRLNDTPSINSPAAAAAEPAPMVPADAIPAEADAMAVPALCKEEPVYDGPERRVAAADSVAGNAIRVDVTLLDRLMNLVGELVLARNQVLQHTSSQKDAALLRTAQRLNLITTELQEGVMKTRMQPIGNLWNKFPRIVRDVANACHKKVRIEMEGRETELDKTILEAIKDPLTHIIRNSVDHGIETPEHRSTAGKAEEGLLFMRAFHEGGQVIIEVTDDGKGINTEVVKRKAIEKGLITSDEAGRMSEREALNLIFAAGFSTAERVTNVSGRGVGMDVVKTNVEKIGGTVDVQSRQGEGTTLRIKIPLTLAIIPALVVTSGGERFAIPQVSLLELVRIDETSSFIETINGTPLYRLRGNLLPLVYLNRELKLDSESSAGTAANIVVLRGGERQFGLVVDQINDTEEIVVKPLAKQLKRISVFAGATIMGDGRVALILDVLGMAQRANVVSRGHEAVVGAASESSMSIGNDRQLLLLFSVSGGQRMAIPLSTVSRLEEVSRTTLEDAGGTKVVQYRGEIMPLIEIAGRFGASPATAMVLDSDPARQAAEVVQIVVHRHDDRYVGLVVEQILDVVEERLQLQKAAARLGVLGTAIIKDRVTEILDVQTVVRMVLNVSEGVPA